MPDRQEIRKKVFHDLSVISGFDEGRIQETDELESDLGLSSDMLGSLAPGFEVIAQAYNPGAVITKSECKKLGSVKQSVDLVFKRCTINREE